MMILSDMINQPSGCNVVFNKRIAMEKRDSSTGAFLSHGGSRTSFSSLFDWDFRCSHQKQTSSGIIPWY